MAAGGLPVNMPTDREKTGEEGNRLFRDIRSCSLSKGSFSPRALHRFIFS